MERTALDKLLHDLKQPLNLIRVTAQEVRLDLRKQRLDLASLAERMLEIEQSVDRATGLVDQLRGPLGAEEDEHGKGSDRR